MISITASEMMETNNTLELLMEETMKEKATRILDTHFHVCFKKYTGNKSDMCLVVMKDSILIHFL